MKDSEILAEQELRDIYYDPSADYQSAERLYQKAKEKEIGVSRRAVRDWLKTQDTYTRYKPITRKHKYRKTYVKDLADQVQLDLVDMGKYGSMNKGYRWILTAVEILSRYAFAIPVYRKDGESMTKSVNLLLKKFRERFGKYPNSVQFDEGKEFCNVGIRNVLKSHDVNYFSTKSEKKAAIVERFNRTLKTMMWKYFYSKGIYAWIDVLDELVKNYNGTKHGSTLIKPSDVNSSNEDAVWVTLYGSALGELALPKFRVGDTVKVSRYKSVFGKGYEANGRNFQGDEGTQGRSQRLRVGGKASRSSESSTGRNFPPWRKRTTLTGWRKYSEKRTAWPW